MRPGNNDAIQPVKLAIGLERLHRDARDKGGKEFAKLLEWSRDKARGELSALLQNRTICPYVVLQRAALAGTPMVAKLAVQHLGSCPVAPATRFRSGDKGEKKALCEALAELAQEFSLDEKRALVQSFVGDDLKAISAEVAADDRLRQVIARRQRQVPPQ